MFYPDLSKEEQRKWLSTLVKHPKECSFHSPKKTVYGEVDVAFVYCLQDQAFPHFAQQAMVNAIKETGVTFREITLDSGHFPMLSMPDVLADEIMGLI